VTIVKAKEYFNDAPITESTEYYQLK